MRLHAYDTPGASLVFEASSSYKNMYDNFYHLKGVSKVNEQRDWKS